MDPVLGEAHPHTQTAWGNFVDLLQQAVAAGRQGDLSDGPLTQAMLQKLLEARKGED